MCEFLSYSVYQEYTDDGDWRIRLLLPKGEELIELIENGEDPDSHTTLSTYYAKRFNVEGRELDDKVWKFEAEFDSPVEALRLLRKLGNEQFAELVIKESKYDGGRPKEEITQSIDNSIKRRLRQVQWIDIILPRVSTEAWRAIADGKSGSFTEAVLFFLGLRDGSDEFDRRLNVLLPQEKAEKLLGAIESIWDLPSVFLNEESHRDFKREGEPSQIQVHIIPSEARVNWWFVTAVIRGFYSNRDNEVHQKLRITFVQLQVEPEGCTKA